ncbi:hypothetical protein HK103_002835 [Boothiomyces macroporosus]|uniref:Thioredoxin-like fold domain-containing protein n=1 Tax=Boothiomyces macroporosus TaxID=261099 RepID=A0AAD5UMY9_9FUNG|nr:hypothetical protein HK103_002815 [Boothiomyces macroporosus]KAJ3259188.1 hypothetical protein HK103_002835 [Boothiomyces macroporosus]
MTRHFINTGSNNVLEVYLDFVCPYSRKTFDKINQIILPHLKTTDLKLEMTFRNHVQPWHPQSTLVHEASLAVEKLAPEKFLAFAQVLFDNQESFFDTAIDSKTRNEIYNDLAELAAQFVNKEEFLNLLRIDTSTKHNNGNQVTAEFKRHLKISRHNHVHVSPTWIINGLINDDISSGWSLDDWKKLLSTLTNNE